MPEQESSPRDTGLLPVTGWQQEALEEAILGYEFELVTATGAQEYLANRGLGLDAVRGARLGLVGDPAPGHEAFVGWLAIPYLDRNGAPLTVRFRCLAHQPEGCKAHGHKMKYATLAGDPARTYNVGAIHRAARGNGVIEICEGEADALVLQQCGLNAIALPGAASWKPRHRVMLAGFNVVQVWADVDEAGSEFAKKIMGSMRSARLVRLPYGDVSEVFVKEGKEGLLALLDGDERNAA